MQRHPGHLHPGGEEREEHAGRAEQRGSLAVTAVSEREDDEQKERRGQVVEDGDGERLRAGDDGGGVGDELERRTPGDPAGRRLRELQVRPDPPRGERRAADGDECRRPEDAGAHGCGVEEEAVDRAAGQRRHGGGGEEEREPPAERPRRVASPAEQGGEQAALEHQAVVGERDVGFGHRRRWRMTVGTIPAMENRDGTG